MTIKYSALLNIVCGYARRKIKENGHKGDPLALPLIELIPLLEEERRERIEAFYLWMDNQTEENATEFLKEVGDEINFLTFISGKVAGYKNMTRE